jgi:hypothetical protein
MDPPIPFIATVAFSVDCVESRDFAVFEELTKATQPHVSLV